MDETGEMRQDKTREGREEKRSFGRWDMADY